jgi:glucosamine 6-phosphate synthetase-like amidotransferase/phosphosugar isomerase protein
MCQLAAYVGDRPIAKLLLDSLRHQEAYVGGQATGLCVQSGDGFGLVKGVGSVDVVRASTGIDALSGTTGMAHSRFSINSKTKPASNSVDTSHPWVDDTGRIALMHNGDIANYKEFWADLRGRHRFQSYIPEINYINDSEVALHMVSEEVTTGRSVPQALRIVMPKLNGMVILGVIDAEQPETVYIANWQQPCWVGVGDDEVMFCSSPIGFKDVSYDLATFEAPKNSLIKLTRGRADLTRLDHGRDIPQLRLNRDELERWILQRLEKGETSVFTLFYELLGGEYAKPFGVGAEEWARIRDAGFGDTNQLFETLNVLVDEGKISERIRKSDDEGIPETPRYHYSLRR